MTRKKTQDNKPTVDELTSPEARESVEAQATQALAQIEASKTALVLQPDVRIEQIAHPQGSRSMARGKGGKFQRKNEAIAQVATNAVAEILMSKDEAGETVHMAMVKNLAKLCREAKDPKELLGACKILQQLEESSGITQSRENLLKAEDKGPQNMTVIFGGAELVAIMQRQFDALLSYVRSLEKRLNVPVEQQFLDSTRPETAPRQTQPSFAAERPQPSFAEVTSIRTDPR